MFETGASLLLVVALFEKAYPLTPSSLPRLRGPAASLEGLLSLVSVSSHPAGANISSGSLALPAAALASLQTLAGARHLEALAIKPDNF